MKLIKRTILHFQDAKSDKVYEVDLCEMGDGYGVNFRYGRRGTPLKEGTKTEKAVSLAAAEKIFEKLVNEKVKKGYRDLGNTTPPPVISPPSPPPAISVASGDPKQQATLDALAKGGTHKWPLERVIWRAGELKITEATPLLLNLIGTGNALRDYCVAWALGWCGGTSDGVMAALIRLYENAKTPEFVSRIAFEALLKLSDAATRCQLHQEMISFLPSELQLLAQEGTAVELGAAVKAYLAEGDYRHFEILARLYQIDNAVVRPVLLEILREAPLKPSYFKGMRHIFKMAEYRRDAEVFGILAYRWETEAAMYRQSRSDYRYVPLPDGGYLRKSEWRYDEQKKRYRPYPLNEFEEEMRRPEPRIAYSNKTREYLLGRVWRTLQGLGELEDEAYVEMAAEVLLLYRDEMGVSPRQTTLYRWDQKWNRIAHQRHWDRFASYRVLNHILYENSPRYILMPHSKAWRCREGYQPGDPEPVAREEAFGHLWERHPGVLLRLLLESGCCVVHQFAAKVLRAPECEQFCRELSTEILMQLLHQPYEVTVLLALERVVSRYDAANPNFELVLSLTNCVSSVARQQAYGWIEQGRQVFLEERDFVVNLVMSQQSETRLFARHWLSSSVFSEGMARQWVPRLIAGLLGWGVAAAEAAKEVVTTLLEVFMPQLRGLGMGVIWDLLRHPLSGIQELGAQILLNHEIPAGELPPEMIMFLMESGDEGVRRLGMQIFGLLPDAVLMGEQRGVILAMVVNQREDIRQGVQPIVHRLAHRDAGFAMGFAMELIGLLALPERHEGVHRDWVRLLRQDIPGWMVGVSQEGVLQLLSCQSSIAQELGGIILGERYSQGGMVFSTADVVKFGNHELLSVRQVAWRMFADNIERYRSHVGELLAAVRLLESKWQDSREFAMKTFRSEFQDQDWTPEVVLSVCDSTWEEARQFGRELALRSFQQSYGQDYLLKFCEHPAGDMQLFATGYLEGYAANDGERLRELMPFLITVLCRVNQGRVAKQRVLAFLEREAQKCEAAAMVVAEILCRQSATVVMGDRAVMMEMMLKIHRQYPDVVLPMQVKPVAAVRGYVPH